MAGPKIKKKGSAKASAMPNQAAVPCLIVLVLVLVIIALIFFFGLRTTA